MQDISQKTNDGGQTASGLLDAGEFNSVVGELENLVTRSGQTLSAGSTTQLALAAFLTALRAQVYQSGGTGDAVVITPITGANSVVLPTDYALLGGARATWIMPGTNTGAVTLNLGPTGGPFLGAKKLLDPNQNDFSGGELVSGTRVEAIYDATADGGSGAWSVTTWALAGSPLAPVGFMAGFQYRLGADALHDIVIGPGQARSAIAATTQENLINTVDRTIAIDNPADRVDGSTLDSNATYFILIGRLAADGAFAAGFSQANAQPTAWRSFRRIGVTRLAGTDLRPFDRIGSRTAYRTPIMHQAETSITGGATIETLTVPNGIELEANVGLSVRRQSGGGNNFANVLPLTGSAAAPSDSFHMVRVSTTTFEGGTTRDTSSWSGPVLTNTTGQVRTTFASSNGTYSLTVIGYDDPLEDI